MIRSSFLPLLSSLFLSLIAATLGGYLTSFSVGDWYTTLTKPNWNPPNWVFGPVWTTLYTMMAVAAWLVWMERPDKRVNSAITLYLIQLLLNASWSGMFFTLESPTLGLINIVLLWLVILWTLVRFYSVSLPAMGLMIPYCLWVTYAMALNYTLWRMNP